MTLWSEFSRAVASCNLGESFFNSASRDFLDDSTATLAIERTIGDLSRSLGFLLDSLGLILNQAGDDWNNLAIELRASMAGLEASSEAIRKKSSDAFSVYTAFINAQQASDARRLTIMATIFLPLGLSSSLLAMSTPAASLGWLWFEWAGLCLLIALPAATVYFGWLWLARTWDRALSADSANSPLKLAVKLNRVFKFRVFKVLLVMLVYLTLVAILIFLMRGMFASRDDMVVILKYGAVTAVGITFTYILAILCSVAYKLTLFLWMFRGVRKDLKQNGISMRQAVELLVGGVYPRIRPATFSLLLCCRSAGT